MSEAEAVLEQPRRSAGRMIVRNTLFGMGAQVALRVLGFVFNVLVIRTLGDSEFGRYSVVLAWAGLFSVIGDMGVTQYMTREVARNAERANQLFWNTAALRFILSIVAIVVTIVGAVAKPYESEVVLAIALYTSSYFLQALLAPLQGIIAGNERLDYLSVFTVIGQIIFMVAGGLFLFAGLNFVWLVVASLLNLPVLIALSFWVVRRYRMQPPRFRVEPRTWGRLLMAGMPFAIIQLALTFNFHVDTLILETFQSAAMVGWYNAAYHLTRSFLILTSALIVAMPVTLAREHAHDPKSVLPWYYRSTKFMVFLGLPLAVGGTLLADKIIRVLYGLEYAPASIAFAILIWDTPLLMYTALCGNLTTAIKKESRAMWIYLSLAALNLVLNLLFIPTYGLIAASLMTVAAELTGAILFYVFFRREFGAGLGFTHMVRLIIAAILMGIVVYLLRGQHLLVNISISAIFYVVVVWLIGALSADERAMLTGMVKRRFGGVLRRMHA
jgi:O-antigen/teichoic acid export membrane protein